MAAAGAALRLRLLYRMLRVGELLALVAFLSWSSSRVPSAAAAVLRLAGSLLLNARFVFVLGNAIVLLLFALSRHDLSAASSSSSSSTSGCQQQAGAATTTSAAAAPAPQDDAAAAPAAASATASIPSSFASTPIPIAPPASPAASLEAFMAASAPVQATAELAAPAAAASSAPAHAGTVFDERPPAAAALARVSSSKLARAPRRSRSEKMAGPRLLQVRRAASPPASELRRSESENGRRRSSVSARDASCRWGADDADEFRRTVEAFIDKHKRFHRQESMTMSVVAGGSGSGGHCEAAPAFTGALAVVE